VSRKVILDIDPGIDDAVALAIALSRSDLDVVAVTAVAGNVPAEQATRNVQALIEHYDPPRWPRIGAASRSDAPRRDRATRLHGDDGLGNTGLRVAERQHQHPAEKIIVDEVRRSPDEVTLVALGPLTNVAAAFRLDPDCASMLGAVVIMGGCLAAQGSVAPGVESNFSFDPSAAHDVFHSSATKTMIPLDVTQQLLWSYDLLDQLPTAGGVKSQFLHDLLAFGFRAHRQELGLEGMYLHDAVALVALTNPELFTTEFLAGDVETSGQLTSGMTVFDRRPHPAWRRNIEVALQCDVESIRDVIVRGLTSVALSR
jgi:inosine-uridine nucleoside N-ribohydrolase